MDPKPVPTVCNGCGLFYIYPEALDTEVNGCPSCHFPNNHGSH